MSNNNKGGSSPANETTQLVGNSTSNDPLNSSIIKSADVVKVHGLAVFFFAAVFFLDTLGGKNNMSPY
jgi:hypothetical protein